METATMGKVLVSAKIENVYDLYEASLARIKPEEVRSVDVADALVDTGASTLSLPKRYVTQLGLRAGRSRQAVTTAGVVTLQMFGPIKLTVQGREWTGDVVEVPDSCPVLLGQIPLESLDFVIDPASQRLIGNPAHGGEQMIELY